MQKQTQPAEPVRKANGSIWDNRFFLGIVSVLAAVLVWMVVSTFLDPQGSFVIKDVSVNYGYQSTIYTSKGLDIVDQQAVDNVQVQADGNGTLIGKLSSSDIMVYPVYNGVQGAGKTTLRLEARITNTDYTNVGIKLTVVSPQTVDVVFDTVGEKTLPVTTDTSGITIADGFTLNRIATTPTEVTLTGPTSELDKISEVVAPVSHEGSLSDSVSATASLELRDENGDIVTPEYTTLDSNTADINLTVYQVRELPLSIVFINAPSGFDTSYLKYSLSIPTLNVAGPAKTVGALTELSVAAFDLGREFAFDRDYQKNIELPAGVVSLDGVSAVTIRFDTTDMTSRTFVQPHFCSRQLYGAVPGKLTITGHPSAGVPAYPMPANQRKTSAHDSCTQYPPAAFLPGPGAGSCPAGLPHAAPAGQRSGAGWRGKTFGGCPARHACAGVYHRHHAP